MRIKVSKSEDLTEEFGNGKIIYHTVIKSVNVENLEQAELLGNIQALKTKTKKKSFAASILIIADINLNVIIAGENEIIKFLVNKHDENVVKTINEDEIIIHI